MNQVEIVFGIISNMRKVIGGELHLGGRLAHEAVEFHRLFQSRVRQAVPLDVHGSSADEGSGVKLGKRVNHGMTPASMTFNYEKPV